MALKLTVNNVETTVDVAPDTPLLWVLRDVLHYTGTKFGCGMGLCGACTVLMNGKAVRSCMTHVSAAVGQPITTIEGLSPDGNHPVQVAWEALDVPQCGYCQSGMMIAAVELLAKNANPTVAQIKDAFTNKAPSPHLCRCGTYAAIIDAVQRAAQSMKG